MSRASEKLRGLCALLDMAFQAEKAKMAQATRQIEDLTSQITALDSPKAIDENPSVVMAEVLTLWETWIADRKKQLNQELALALRNREALRPLVSKAFARREAASKALEAQLATDAKIRAARLN